MNYELTPAAFIHLTCWVQEYIVLNEHLIYRECKQGAIILDKVNNWWFKFERKDNNVWTLCYCDCEPQHTQDKWLIWEVDG